jgi:hypothetical protein
MAGNKLDKFVIYRSGVNMKRLSFPLDELEYSGDWRTRLLNALDFAELTKSSELRSCIDKMRSLLETGEDECKYCVTVKHEIPDVIDIDRVIKFLPTVEFGMHVEFQILSPRILTVTLEMRGSREYVEKTANWIARRLISEFGQVN